MKTLHRALDRRGEDGAALPAPFHSLAGAGVAFRRKNVSMLAGEPGSFKSIMALNIVTSWAHRGFGTLYLSADGDEDTVLHRSASILTGTDHSLIHRHLHEAATALRTIDHVRFAYVTGTIATIDDHMKAYRTLYGKFPDNVVIDNAMDFVEGAAGAEEWMAMRQLLKDSVTLAAASNSHVMILHHCNEQKATEEYPVGWPPPRWLVQGKITQKPALVLTLGANGDRLGLAVVKNRHGITDKAARNPLWFTVNPAMQIREDYRQEMIR